MALAHVRVNRRLKVGSTQITEFMVVQGREYLVRAVIRLDALLADLFVVLGFPRLKHFSKGHVVSLRQGFSVQPFQRVQRVRFALVVSNNHPVLRGDPRARTTARELIHRASAVGSLERFPLFGNLFFSAERTKQRAIRQRCFTFDAIRHVSPSKIRNRRNADRYTSTIQPATPP